MVQRYNVSAVHTWAVYVYENGAWVYYDSVCTWTMSRQAAMYRASRLMQTVPHKGQYRRWKLGDITHSSLFDAYSIPEREAHGEKLPLA